MKWYMVIESDTTGLFICFISRHRTKVNAIIKANDMKRYNLHSGSEKRYLYWICESM